MNRGQSCPRNNAPDSSRVDSSVDANKRNVRHFCRLTSRKYVGGARRGGRRRGQDRIRSRNYFSEFFLRSRRATRLSPFGGCGRREGRKGRNKKSNSASITRAIRPRMITAVILSFQHFGKNILDEEVSFLISKTVKE